MAHTFSLTASLLSVAIAGGSILPATAHDLAPESHGGYPGEQHPSEGQVHPSPYPHESHPHGSHPHESHPHGSHPHGHQVETPQHPVEIVKPGLEQVTPTHPSAPAPAQHDEAIEVEVVIDNNGRTIVPQPVGTFTCTQQPHPTTVFHSPGGSLPVIHWVSDYFTDSGYDPLTRCIEVSRRFQTFHDAGILNYLTTGIVNRLPVVCVSGDMGGPCTGVLLTLKPGQNASLTVQRLFDLSYGQRVGALYESGSRIYIDFDRYMEELSQR